MKILIVTQYFWPESFRINDLALGLLERGHEVSVLTGKPNYPSGSFFEGYSFSKKSDEDWKGIKIYRSNLIPRGKSGGIRLMLNYLSFAFFAFFKSLFIKEKYDLIFVYEPSPITVGIPAVFLSKKLKVPMYFWVQDLWPESVSVAGQIENKFILGILDRLTRWIYKNSKKVLIQSEGFREYILNQKVSNDKIIYYPNSTESMFGIVKPSENIRKLVPRVPFSIMFAGNIGEAQDFENILSTAKKIKGNTSDIHFIILGSGRKKDYVFQKIKEYDLESNFHLLGSFPVDTMPHFFACSDALLVTLKKSKIFSLTIPSKIQSYLACGKPIIAGLDGEGAKVIKESKSGFTAPSSDSKKLEKAIMKLYTSSLEERKEFGNNAIKYFNDNFERERLLTKLIEIFENE
ncbi:Glycosyltransferase involved in cell wall biosynthesis [Tenacibaculum sp. 190524A02b]|uniref:glycosyltransferase family 4 protein n=1 Tax=Tenacibaculum vairaonense TaxID=3137860 RepID=UPI0032B1ABB8